MIPPHQSDGYQLCFPAGERNMSRRERGLRYVKIKNEKSESFDEFVLRFKTFLHIFVVISRF